jgi:Ser/Thr protein kinase RdoA (MazF antagonist)
VAETPEDEISAASGRRLEMRRYRHDEAVAHEPIYDTELDLHCTFGVADDGIERPSRDQAMTHRFSEDPGALAVLEALGGDAPALLGRGGEASVYALDPERVLRIQRPGAKENSVRARASLLDELRSSADRLSFSIPRVLEIDFVAERWVSVETRLPGRSLESELETVVGPEREALIRLYLSAANELGDLTLSRRFFGELHEGDPIRGQTWRDYLERRARHSLELGGDVYSSLSPSELTAPFEEPRTSALVYLDAYPGNVLVEEGGVTAILDFGGGVLIGDPRFNALAAATYLSGEDRAIGEAWLAERGVTPTGPFRRWLAAYWAFARDDEALAAWCRSELL